MLGEGEQAALVYAERSQPSLSGLKRKYKPNNLRWRLQGIFVEAAADPLGSTSQLRLRRKPGEEDMRQKFLRTRIALRSCSPGFFPIV